MRAIQDFKFKAIQYRTFVNQTQKMKMLPAKQK